MKRLISIVAMLTVIVAANAQNNGAQYKYFRKGFYLGTEAFAGVSMNERIVTYGRNTSYGIDIAAGYRFCPQFVLGIGFGGHAYTSHTASVSGGEERPVQTTSVPVFLRMRSDFIDARVSPYMQMDFGYAFVFQYSRDAADKIKFNNDVFMDRVYAKGYETLDEYEAAFRENHSGGDPDDIDALWQSELNSLKCFSNGRREYITLENTHIQYGKNGLFANLELGVGWKVGDNNRMNVGISAGLTQSYYGTCLRTVDNNFISFGREDYLPYDKGQDKTFVRTIGQEDFKDSFELDLRVKLGFSF